MRGSCAHREMLGGVCPVCPAGGGTALEKAAVASDVDGPASPPSWTSSRRTGFSWPCLALALTLPHCLSPMAGGSQSLPPGSFPSVPTFLYSWRAEVGFGLT